MKRLTLLLGILLVVDSAFACLETYQFKMFPVGTSEGKIYTVDVQIRRTNQRPGKYSNMEVTNGNEFDAMFILWSHVSVYDQNQKLLTSTPLDTNAALGNHYLSVLQSTYAKGLAQIKEKYKNIELFTPEYISYCDYQDNCKLVSYKGDTLGHYFLYNKQKYVLSIMTDTAYYGFNTKRYDDVTDFGSYSISSVRIYKNSSMQLLMVDMGTGQIMYDAKGHVIRSKEYAPDISFKDISTSVYEEPLMHHGYGFDIFIVI